MNEKKLTLTLKEWLIPMIIILLPIVYFGWIVFSALSILGPWDKPRFEDKDWVSLKVRYGLAHKFNEEVHREMIISGNELVELKKLFSTKKSGGVSTPNYGFLQLKLSNGTKWDIQFGTARTLRFCLNSDNYYAYLVGLDNTQFYKKLREYCLKNEQKITPYAKIENINICTNRQHIHRSELPEWQPKIVDEFIMIGMRGELSEVLVPLSDSFENSHGEQKTEQILQDDDGTPQKNETK